MLKDMIREFINKYFIYVLILLFGALYAFISVTKYQHFQTGLDLAIYVQTFWFYTHLKLPFVTLYPTYGGLVWADHFSPSLMLFTPLYFFWKDPKLLLIIQSFLFVSGAFPIYRFAKEKLKSNFLALALSFVFLTYFGLQYPLTFDFHIGTIAAAFFPWILLSMLKGKWKTFIILCVIAMGFKEDMPLYVTALSLYLIASRKNWKLGIILGILSFGYYYLVTQYLMPLFAHMSTKQLSLSYLKFTPNYFWSVFFDSSIKINTLFLTFANFLFLPLLSGFFLILLLAHFFINFSNPAFPGRWGIYLHYRGYTAGMMAFAWILSYTLLIKLKPVLFERRKVKIIFASL